jgi:hypothetical protein
VNRRRWVPIAGAVLAVGLGGGAALAAAGSSDPASDFLGDVAKRLGISQDKLEGAIEDARAARIDAAVAAGDITKAEGEALKQRIRSGDLPALPPFGLGPPPALERHAPPVLPPGGPFLEAAARYLGMEEADVRDALADGKSLADLAKEQRKSVDGLEDALRDAIREDADRAVDDGLLTKEQADRMVEKLGSTVDELVDRGFHFEFRFGVGPDERMPPPRVLPFKPS